MKNIEKILKTWNERDMARILLDATDTSCDFCPGTGECRQFDCHSVEGWERWLKAEVRERLM